MTVRFNEGSHVGFLHEEFLKDPVFIRFTASKDNLSGLIRAC